ncbi:MAG: EAL domain-containing protein [Actinobacteria bacterium]|nr:EAL domain-containing protein [Actinomycetota bacterium]
MNPTRAAVWNGTWRLAAAGGPLIEASAPSMPSMPSMPAMPALAGRSGDAPELTETAFDLTPLPPGIHATVAVLLGDAGPGFEATLRIRDSRDERCELNVRWEAAGPVVTVRGAADPPPSDDPRQPDGRARRLSTGPGLWLLDGSGRTSWINERLVELSGRPFEDLRERSPLDLVAPEDRWRVAELFTDASRPNEVGDVRLRRPDGVERWVIVATTPVVDDDGGNDGTFVVVTDVTDRRAREQALADAEERFRRSFAEASGGTALVSPDGGTLEVNRALSRLLGEPPAELTGRPFTDLLHPDDRAEEQHLLANALASGIEGYTVERRLVGRDGLPMWADLTASVVRSVGGDVLHIVYQLDDVTARRATDALTREAVARYQAAFAHAPCGLAVLDPDGTICEANQSLCRLVGLEQGLVRNQRLGDLVDDDDRSVLESHLADVAGGRTSMARVDVRLCAAPEAPAWAAVTITAIAGEDGRAVNLVAQIEDITEQRAAEHDLVHQTLHDPLTGLGNRLLLRERLQHAIARSGPRGFAVMYLDLDRFKSVNDAHGHDVGDGLLVAVAGRLRRAVRTGDTVTRLGGDEFAIVAPGVTDEAAALALAEKMRAALAEPFRVGETDLGITASIGVVLAGPEVASGDQLLHDADVAMYRAKDAGRDRSEVFDDALRLEEITRHETERTLRAALDDEGLRLHYQPLVDLHTGRAIGAEALLRVLDPQQGLLPPSRFLGIAEDTRLIVEVGAWVLDEACAQLARWDVAGFGRLVVAVNVSAAELSATGFADKVRGALERHHVDPRRLRLELGEHSVLMAPADTVEELQALAETGVSIGLDDFGTGSSSLALLRDVPVRFVKIDPSFVRRIEQPTGAALVEAIVALARSTGLQVVAEGVETARQLELLAQMGCDAAQGHLFAPASPPDAIPRGLGVGRPPAGEVGP